MGNKCLGQAVRPNEPQRKSDTETRVDPKTSPVPRLEGNPPAGRRYSRRAGDCHPWLSTTTLNGQSPNPRSLTRPNLEETASKNRKISKND